MTQLSDLRQQVRWRTNTENNQVVTDAELNYYINNSIKELDDILCQKSEDYRLKSVQIVISTGSTFPLPADFYQFRGLDFFNPSQSQPNPWMTMQRFNLQERNRGATFMPPTVFPFFGLYYKLEDTNVAVIPVDKAAGTYQLWYVPVLPTLVNDTDAIPSYLDNQAWSEYAVVDASIKVLQKQGDPDGGSQAFMMQKEGLKVRIEAMSASRDKAMPKSRINVRQGWDDLIFWNYPYV